MHLRENWQFYKTFQSGAKAGAGLMRANLTVRHQAQLAVGASSSD